MMVGFIAEGLLGVCGQQRGRAFLDNVEVPMVGGGRYLWIKLRGEGGGWACRENMGYS